MSARLIFAVIVFGLLFYFVGVQELILTLSQVRIDYLIILILLSVVLIWASCLKWQLFVRANGHEVSLLTLMNLYTVGYFFNTFTPSYVGGDVARSFHLGRFLNSQRDAFVATFLERFTGLLAMALLGVTFVVFGTEATAGVEYAVLLVGAGALVLAAICFSKKVGEWAFAFSLSCMRRFSMDKLADKIEPVFSKLNIAMAEARTNPRLFVHAMLLSLFFHILTVVNTYVAARAIGWEDPSFSGLFVVVPLVLLVSMVPLTPSGLGIQEGAFLFFLERIGATRAQGLMVGVVLRAKVTLVAMIGGLLWLRIRRKEKPEVAGQVVTS